MTLRQLYTISLILACGCCAKGQDNQGWGAGLNLSNNLTNLIIGKYSYQGGYAIEPAIVYKPQQSYYLKCVLGISHVSWVQEIGEGADYNQEIIYKNQGVYLKPGFFLDINKSSTFFHHGVGLSLGYVNFHDFGEYTIPGRYLGNLEGSFQSGRQQLLFLEPQLDLHLWSNDRFGLLLNLNFPIHLYETFDNDYPGYYIPGVGGRIDDDIASFLAYRVNCFLMVKL